MHTHIYTHVCLNACTHTVLQTHIFIMKEIIRTRLCYDIDVEMFTQALTDCSDSHAQIFNGKIRWYSKPDK